MTAQQEMAQGPTRDHNSYIGGSDIAAVIGVNPYASALDVWAVKTKRVPGFAGNEATEVGDELERPVLNLYRRRHKVTDLTYPGTITHPALLHIAATPDAMADGRPAQVKIVGNRQAHRWGEPSDGINGIPAEVVCQVTYEATLARHVFGVAGDDARVLALVGTDLRVFEMPVDTTFGDDLVSIADDFWTRCIVGGVIPEVTGRQSMDTLRRIFSKAHGDMKPATEEVITLAREYAAERANEKIAKEAKELVGSRICALIGNGAGFVSPENGIKVGWPQKAGSVSWKEVAVRYRDVAVRLGAHGVDLDRIEAECRGDDSRTIDVRVKGK